MLQVKKVVAMSQRKQFSGNGSHDRDHDVPFQVWIESL